MTATTAPTKQILMSDMFTIDNNVDFRRFKVSARSADFEDAYTDRGYVLSSEYSVNAGQWLAMNITDKIDSAITSVSVNGPFEVQVRSDHATGTQDGTVTAANKNLISNVDGFAKGTLFYSAVPVGSVLAAGYRFINPNVVCNKDSAPSVLVFNDSAETKVIRITVGVLEFGERPAAKFLTYNGAALTYNQDELYYV